MTESPVMTEDATNAIVKLIPNGFMKDHRLPNRHPPATTHDLSRSEYHIQDIKAYLAVVEQATQKAFPNEGKSRYSAVNVLLLSWEDDDLQVIAELERLRQVFELQYQFSAEQWSIPSSDSHGELQDRLRAFIKTYGKEDALLIVYYGGHGYLDDFRQPVWLSNQKPGASSLKWYSHQVTLEETKSDVLILLDCYHAGGSSGDANKGTKEVIAACGFESWAAGVGDHSFTKSLIDEFEYLSTGPAFSASSLHSRVLDRIKHWNPVYNAKEREVEDTDGRFRDKERRKCPVYISLNKDTTRKSIEIVSHKVSSRKLAFSKASRYADPVERHGCDHHTEVTLAIQVESGQILHTQDLIAWIREIPLLAKSVKLQAVQKSHSTLLLISLPVAVWNLLPDDPACSFVGFTTSSNLLLGNSQNSDNKLVDKSHASTELGPQLYETIMDHSFLQERHTPALRNPESHHHFADSEEEMSISSFADSEDIDEPSMDDSFSQERHTPSLRIPESHYYFADSEDMWSISSDVVSLKRSKEATIWLKRWLKSYKRTFMVPLDRNLNFVGRMDFIAELDQTLNSQHRVALAGIGGIGKTQIAIEYCYRFRDRHPNASVFWVPAGTITRFNQVYEAIAYDLGLVRKDDRKANTLQLVTDWLNNEDNDNWLLVLDGADDQAVFESTSPVIDASGQHSKPLAHYISYSQKGSTIITTRDSHVAEILKCGKKPLSVSFFNEQVAKTLLRSKLNRKIGWIEEDAQELVEALEFLPLAVTQAAAFINENNVTVKKYTEIFQTSGSHLTTLVNQDVIDVRTDLDASSPISRTLQVSFDQLRIQKPRAAELLSLMAVLDRQGIPKPLLYENGEEQFEIIAALKTLQAFSLISSDKEKGTFEMHSLVQLFTLKWLETQNEKLKWERRALRLLSKKFPSGDIRTWKICALYLPHVMIVIDNMMLGPDDVNDLGLLVDTAYYVQSQGKHKMAEQILRRALNPYKITNGNSRSETLRSQKLLEEILNRQAKYDDAEKLLRTVLILRERTLGREHEFTLATVSSLASVLVNKGRYEEAKKMLEENVEIQSEVLGEERGNTLKDMKNLAVAYRFLNQLSKAKELQVQLLKKTRKFTGEEHSHTLFSMADLAATCVALNHMDEAEKLAMQVLNARKMLLGAEHLDTLRSMASLAEVYVSLNRLDEARKLEEQVFKAHKRILGAEHPTTLMSMADLAVTYTDLKRLNEAEELGVEVLRVREKVLGAEHPDTLLSMANLAVTYKTFRRWSQAEELEEQVLKVREKAFPAEHPDTLLSMANLAVTYKTFRRWSQAEELEVKVLKAREKALGSEHPNTLLSMANLAVTYQALDRLYEAEKLQLRFLMARQINLGAEHPDTLLSMVNLAGIYVASNRLDEAKELDEQVLKARDSVLGREHPDTLSSMANLAVTYKVLNRLNEAEGLEVQVLKAREETLGSEHSETLSCMSDLAETYVALNRLDKAEKLQVQVLNARKKALGSEHPDTLLSMANLALTYWDLNRLSEAEKLRAQVLEAHRNNLGEEHPDTLLSMANLAWIWKKQDRLEAAISLMSDAARLSKTVLGANNSDFQYRSQCSTRWMEDRPRSSRVSSKSEKNRV